MREREMRDGERSQEPSILFMKWNTELEGSELKSPQIITNNHETIATNLGYPFVMEFTF